MDPATVVIDNGTGYTKMGYAGNMEPSYIIPSVIAKAVQKVSPLKVPTFFRFLLLLTKAKTSELVFARFAIILACFTN